jgi:hypothetical protein
VTFGAADLVLGPGGPRVLARPAAAERLVPGRPASEVADLLPRLFNLCRAAQSQAARLALGLPPGAEDPAAEALRDHQAKVFVTLRRDFGLPPVVPRPLAPLPSSLAELAAWMEAATPEADLARAIRAAFSPGWAVVPRMAFPVGMAAFAPGPFDNSAAGRQAAHPLLAALERLGGRGPLWRYLGLLADAEAAAAGLLPAPVVGAEGAVVQAARGAYALRIAQEGGVVTAMTRITPTDHQLAPDGPLTRALAALPADRGRLAPLVLALHDPCLPVTVREAGDA